MNLKIETLPLYWSGFILIQNMRSLQYFGKRRFLLVKRHSDRIL